MISRHIRFIGPLLLLIAFSQLRAAPVHPLDPLSAEEVDAASRIIRASSSFPDGGLFSTIMLREPSKESVLGFRSGMPFGREAFAIVMDVRTSRTFEAVVDLRAGRVASWKEIPGVQPQVFVIEYELVPGIVKADPRWQTAMRRRGIDPDSVQIDSWAAGQVPARFGGRLLRAITYYKGSGYNFYGRPVEGVAALVDMEKRAVVEFSDAGLVPLPPPGQELDTASIGKMRAAPKPLVISQPQGPSFSVDGGEVRWQGWHFRFSMHPREGVVLHTVGYEDQGRERPILYRGSLSEMVVPYADPDENWRWRSAFDVGEYGVGRLTSPLELGIDVPYNAMLFDAVFADDSGRAYTLPQAIGLYERDGGILWKHYDTYSLTNESRRARQLVLMSVACIGNYDYSISWIFHQDGTLEVDAGLTGIMLPKGVAETTENDHDMAGSHGHLVAPNVIAPHHQHFFCFRLDMDVDGTANSVSELGSFPVAQKKANPSGNVFEMKETSFHTERGAARSMDMASSRSWRIFNIDSHNELGHHAGYVLLPGANSVPFALAGSSVRKRAGFVDHHFWTTRYHIDEMSAAGAYPNQSRGGDGLPRWIADNEPIEQKDLVLWYTMGTTHIPRPEEWPVMPVSHIGFKLLPAGFFSRNPALDVPR